jgi:uncharacterized protein YcbK (DUF882 family)
MGDLTRNFSMREFMCPHCKEEPNWENITMLAMVLQKYRYVISGYRSKDTPLYVTSGYRCIDYQKIVNEKNGNKFNKNSMHIKSLAADILKVVGMTTSKMGRLALLVPEFQKGGIIVYKTHVHLDLRWIVGSKPYHVLK